MKSRCTSTTTTAVVGGSTKCAKSLPARTGRYLRGLCRTVARAGDVRGEGLFGVVHMLGDQLLVGVLGAVINSSRVSTSWM